MSEELIRRLHAALINANGMMPCPLYEDAIKECDSALSRAPAVAGEQRHYDSSTAAVPPAGHPLQKLGGYLASLLDEDRWATAEQYLLAAWYSVAASATPPYAEQVPEVYRLQPHSEFDAMNAFIRGETKVPPGYALVPVEPTPQMLDAIANTVPCMTSDARFAYRAMLAAAPTPATLWKRCCINCDDAEYMDTELGGDNPWEADEEGAGT